MRILEKLVRKASHRALGELADDENYQFLRKHNLFRNLSADAFLFIMKRIVERRYNRGEVVFKQGNPGICLFLIKKGHVNVSNEVGPNDEPLSIVVREGALFGEMSVISLEARTMTATAAEPGTVLLALSTFDLEALSESYPKDAVSILKGITHTISCNLQETTARLKVAEAQAEELRKQLDDHDNG
jgi:CRP-like cAMP-binding protein